MSRSIWIGDVHGCALELSDLLDKLGPTTADRVIFVGDLVARGPDTPGVLRIVRQLGSLCVLGNHEVRLLSAHRARLARERGPQLGSVHHELLSSLSEEDWEQLRALPLSLEFAEHNIRVVHAGVVPGVPFSEQEPWGLLHIRSLTKQGSASDRFSPTSWAATYNEAPHIVFGHNAQAGLQLHPWATGLDTGCVYGGSLTALVLEAGASPPAANEREECLVSVLARARYVDSGPRPERREYGL